MRHSLGRSCCLCMTVVLNFLLLADPLHPTLHLVPDSNQLYPVSCSQVYHLGAYRLVQIRMVKTNSKRKEGYKSKIKNLGFIDRPQEGSPPSHLTKKEASKETRRRKKIYITILEAKLKDKEQQLSHLRAELEELRKHKGVKDPSFSSNLKHRAELFEKISESIGNQNQVQTKLYLEMLRAKLGVAGSDRQHMLGTLLRQFVELIMPMHLRYLLEVCDQKKEFYQLFTENSAYKLHMNFSFLDLKQKKELASIRPLLCTYKHSYQHIIQQIASLNQIIVQQNNMTQVVIDNLQKAFSPCFVAEFLLKLDQKRTCSQEVGGVFPLNYLEIVFRKQEESQRQKYLQEVYHFSMREIDTLEMPPVSLEDDFHYLL